MEKHVLISQRIPVSVMEQAIRAVLDGTYNYDLALELAKSEYQGENRQKKAATFIGRLTERNPLMPFIREHQQETLQALAYRDDRALIMSALICASFPFGYDVLWMFGKYFHVQEIVPYRLLADKLAESYGTNRQLFVGLSAILPMFKEAGIIDRPKEGFYSKPMLELQSDISTEFYRKAFFINNPLKNPHDDWSDSPFFEFLY